MTEAAQKVAGVVWEREGRRGIACQGPMVGAARGRCTRTVTKKVATTYAVAELPVLRRTKSGQAVEAFPQALVVNVDAAAALTRPLNGVDAAVARTDASFTTEPGAMPPIPG